MIRKFKLINATGAEWDLMRNDGFFYAPEGLGVAQDNEYMRIGSTYELVQKVAAQKAVNGTMMFSSYSVYHEFSRFIVFAPLKLAYMPVDEGGGGGYNRRGFREMRGDAYEEQGSDAARDENAPAENSGASVVLCLVSGEREKTLQHHSQKAARRQDGRLVY